MTTSVLHRALGAAPEARDLTFQDVWGKGLDVFGTRTAAGVVVNDRSAMCLSAVFGSVRILAEGVSTLPIESEVRAPWMVTPSVAYPHLSMMDVLGMVVVSLLHRGGAFVLTSRTPQGEVLELEVLSPDACELVAVGTPKRTRFRVDGANRLLRPDEVAYVPGLMMPGATVGMAPLDYARETIGLALAAQTFGAGFFGNGANPSAVIEVEKGLSPEEASFLRQQFEKLHRGAKKSGGTAVLTENAKYKPISVTPEQAQFLATREFQVADIARFFGVPPHLLQDASGSTSWGSGLAEQSVNYVTHSLRPWVERIEWLLTRLAGAPVSLSMDHLLRGDTETRVDTATKAVTSGLLTPDEGRVFIDARYGPAPDGTGTQLRPPTYTEPAKGADNDDA